MVLRGNRYNQERPRSPLMNAMKGVKNISDTDPRHDALLRAARNVAVNHENSDERAVLYDQEGCLMLRQGKTPRAQELFNDALKNFSDDNFLGIARTEAHAALAYTANNPGLAHELINEALDNHDRDIARETEGTEAWHKGVHEKEITENSYLARVMIATNEDREGHTRQLLKFCHDHNPSIDYTEYQDAINFALKIRELPPPTRTALKLRRIELELANDTSKRISLPRASRKLANLAVGSSLHTSKWIASKSLDVAVSAAQHARQAISNRE